MKLLRRNWQRAEKSVAKLEGGKLTKATGAMWHDKADVRSATRLLQVKSTTKKSYVVKLTDLAAIERQAAAADKSPALIIEFQTPKGIRRYEIQPYFGQK